MSIRILILGLCLIQSSLAFSKPKSDIVKRSPFVPEKFNFPVWNEEEIVMKLKASEKKRKPANSASIIDQSMMSKELKDMQARIHGLKTSEGMDSLLTELDKNYDSYPTDLKFYVTQVMPVKAFRGLFYRLKPLFDGKSNYVHSQILTTAKSMATKVQVFLPYEYADAGFQFVSTPFIREDGRIVEGFGVEEDLQVWMINELLPLVNSSIARLEKLNLVDPVVWDQKMVFGPKSFGDDVNRYKLVGEFEKNLAISSLYSSVASMATARAYSVENAIGLYKEVGFLYGFDGFGIFNRIDGVSAEKVSKVMKKAEFAETGTLIPDGDKWMAYAYSATQKSLKRLIDAWNLTSDDRKNENLYAFNMGFVNVNRDEVEDNLKILNRVISSKGTESLRSAVTGEVVQVNYSKLFSSPPKDLKAFLPTQFDKNKNSSREVTLTDGTKKTLNYRNYAQGSASGWDVKKYETYFPSIKSNDDVYRTVRVLNHIQGNWLSIR
jgi:hypothetical protein